MVQLYYSPSLNRVIPDKSTDDTIPLTSQEADIYNSGKWAGQTPVRFWSGDQNYIKKIGIEQGLYTDSTIPAVYNPPKTGGPLVTPESMAADTAAAAAEQEKIKNTIAAQEADAAAQQKNNPTGSPYTKSAGTEGTPSTDPILALSKNNPYGLAPNTSGPNGVMIDSQGFVVKNPIAGTPGAPAPVVPAPVIKPAAAPLTITGNLQQGIQSAEVTALQGILGIKQDGVFGPKTEAAVKSFQASHGLVTDGIVGPKTLQAINDSLKSPSPASNVDAGIKSKTGGAPPTAPAKPQEAPSTGNPIIDSLISAFNNQSPQKSVVDVYKEVYTSMGLDTMKSDYEAQTKAYTDLQNKKNDEKQVINNNPWYSEGIRLQKLAQLDKAYEGKETILTNKLKLLETNISNGRADAQFITGQTMDQLQQSSKLTEDIIMKAIDIAEKQAEAERKPSTTDQKDAAEINSIISQLKTGKDGYTDPYLFIKVRTSSRLSPSEFNSRFGYLINPASKKIIELNSKSTEDYAIDPTTELPNWMVGK